MNNIESLSDVQTEDSEGIIEDRITKNVRFKEGGEGPMENMAVDSTPVSVITWKDKLLGESGSGSLGAATNIDLELKDGDILRSVTNGIPGIDFSDRIKKILVRDMESTMVVKLLGRNIGYGALHNRILNLWKPSQPFRLMDVANGYYLVRFQSMGDYEMALTPGPWTVFGHYLTVQPWIVDFDPSRPFPNGILAWIRFPVDLEKSLTSQVWVNGRLQRVEFEPSPVMGGGLVAMDEAFGPWMVVERKS
ncbi:hypothetical protein Goklo_001274 [Gossypium klotzschianum]|uniref:DUF4283 domain-containing protein n=1 Tax=Gossypium klotzschianum TaxID=34286 RepID=A0A7J8W0E7_9ROSI|nr:hypothetical protein [Gossypium klotzschianum]